MVVLALALCAGCMVRAQNRRVHPLQEGDIAYVLGFKGGLTYSDRKVRDGEGFNWSSDSRTGIYLGVIYRQPVTGNWAVQPELVYSSQGYKETYRSGGEEWVFENKQGYVNLPFLVQYLSPGGMNWYSGPQAGFLLINSSYFTQGVDLSWVVGVGYLSQRGLGIDARYNAGLLNTIANPGVTWPSKVKNRVVQAGVVFLLAPARKRPARHGQY